MRHNAISFNRVIYAAIPTVFATLTPTLAKADIPIDRLTGGSSGSIPTAVLIGTPQLAPITPTTPKRWTPSPVTDRSVPTFWAISPTATAPIASQPTSNPPQVANAESANTETTSTRIVQRLTAEATNTEPESAEVINPDSTNPQPVATEVPNIEISQTLPSLEDIQQIQRDLRDIYSPGPVLARRSVYPGITISNPSGYGADGGQIYAGIGYQSRTRFSGGANPGTFFGGGRRDGTAGIGFGLGNARESVGVQISYTAASFGGSRPRFSGGLNAKIHKQFGNGWAAAIGGEGIINFGRLPEDDDQIEFNDFENTYYGVITKTISLREDFNQPFSRLILTGGAGSGRFRTVDQLVNGEFAVGVFGSAALQVLPSTTLITEWTGQDLAVGLSVAPFPNFPLVFTPAIRDLAGTSDGDPRFVLGVGISISDIFSKLGL